MSSSEWTTKEGCELECSCNVCHLLVELGLILQMNGDYASSLNGKRSEVSHQILKNVVHLMLQRLGS